MKTRDELKEQDNNQQEKMLHNNLKYLDLSKVFSDADSILNNYTLKFNTINSTEQRRASLLARLLLVHKRRLILLSHKINTNDTNKGTLESLRQLRRQKLEILNKLEKNINKLNDILQGCLRPSLFKSSNLVIKLKLTKKSNHENNKIATTDLEEKEPTSREIKKHKKRISVSYTPSSRVPNSMFEDNFFLEFGENGVSRKAIINAGSKCKI
ncbi:MAG: hypothetical protein ABI597_03105 [Gammaproteobacteria bacterium]